MPPKIIVYCNIWLGKNNSLNKNTGMLFGISVFLFCGNETLKIEIAEVDF